MNCPGGQVKILKLSYEEPINELFIPVCEIWSYSFGLTDDFRTEVQFEGCRISKAVTQKQVHVHTSCVFFSNIALCTFVSCSRTSSFACSACRCASHSAFRLCIIKSICRINSINSDSQLLKSVPPNLHLTNHLEKRALLPQRFQLTINVRFIIPETQNIIPQNLRLFFSLKKWKQIIRQYVWFFLFIKIKAQHHIAMQLTRQIASGRPTDLLMVAPYRSLIPAGINN